MGLSERKKREIRALAKSSSEALVALAKHNLRNKSKQGGTEDLIAGLKRSKKVLSKVEDEDLGSSVRLSSQER